MNEDDAGGEAKPTVRTSGDSPSLLFDYSAIFGRMKDTIRFVKKCKQDTKPTVSMIGRKAGGHR